VLILKTLGLYVVTALAEIIGCYLPYLWLKRSGSPWLLIPGMASLALFVWLLTLHPAALGRVYAAYGGVYVAVALIGYGRSIASPSRRGISSALSSRSLGWVSLSGVAGARERIGNGLAYLKF
jgi:drug/metabolite transporter superfamily protein YnfA